MTEKTFFRRLTANALWLYADRLLRGGLSLVVGIIVARYLGPQQYGEYSYVLGLVVLLASIGTLGLDLIIVRMLVNSPNDEPEILGTSTVLRLGASGVAYIITVSAVVAGKPGDGTALALALLVGLSPVFQVTGVIDLFFQSRIHSSNTVKCKLGAGAVMITVRILLIYWGAGLIAFAATVAGELALVAICLVYRFYRYGGRIQLWHYNRHRALLMIREGWPLMAASAAIAIYLRIDQVMLEYMNGDVAVGLFSVAARLTEIFVIAATVLAQTIFPAMSDLYEASLYRYNRTLSAIMFGVFWVSFIFSGLVSIFSSHIIIMIFGNRYVAAGSILSIYVFNTVTMSVSVIFTPKYILDGIANISFYGTIAGAVFSVAANLMLIPRYGVLGAAWSALLAQLVPTLFVGLFFRRDIGVFFFRAPFAASDMLFLLRRFRSFP